MTTLRDEAGDGQRVIFLELPTSISAAAHRYVADGGEGKLAQSWWVVKRIIRRYRLEDSPCFVGDALFERFARSSKIDSSSRTTGISWPTGVQGATAAALEEQKVLERQPKEIRNDLTALDKHVSEERSAGQSRRKEATNNAREQQDKQKQDAAEIRAQIETREREISAEKQQWSDLERKYAKQLKEKMDEITLVSG